MTKDISNFEADPEWTPDLTTLGGVQKAKEILGAQVVEQMLKAKDAEAFGEYVVTGIDVEKRSITVGRLRK